jgi:soluble lytic murein transglycosylase-like protein
MKIPRNIPHFRSFKLAPFALISLFLFTNLTGIFFSHVFAPSVEASTAQNTPPDVPTSGDPDLDGIILRVGLREGIDPRFIHAVIWQESNYDRNAHSPAGAQGVMQLMPATARRFGCNNVADPESNVQAGTKYLSWLLKRFDGNVEMALAGYNAGEGAVDKFGGVPPYSETQNYVRNISARYGKAYNPVLVTDTHSAQAPVRPSGE